MTEATMKRSACAKDSRAKGSPSSVTFIVVVAHRASFCFFDYLL
jgi:hypothetical protein